MGQQTVIVLDNQAFDEAQQDPARFVQALEDAFNECQRTHQGTHIGHSYGWMMPCHHGYDPALYLSYGGILQLVGKTTVERLPRSREDIENIIATIAREHVSLLGRQDNEA